MEINYLDLFSGIGGFSEGIRQALSESQSENSTDNQKRTSQHGRCPFHWHGFSEINKYAIQVYKRHFPKAVELGAIESIDGRKLPKLNLVTFGFPCQDLSIAGKRTGLEGKRSGLFFEAIRIIDENKPDYFVFENVKGLLSSNDGKDFETVLRTIADIGYDGQWQLLNTSWFLPQNRERVYFVGHIRGKCKQEIFPIGKATKSNSTLEKPTKSTIGCLSARGAGEYHSGMKLIECIPVLTPDRINKRQNGRRFKENGEDSFTLTGQDKHGIMRDNKIRRLTPTECARLQGFEDNWCEGLSDTQAYKCYGNAVSVPVVKVVMKKLYKAR